MKKVVVVGGGNGTAIILQALKPHADLAAVVSTSDSGGSSGRLRREFDIIPTGDVLRAVLGLSRYDYHTLRSIFYKTRFQNTRKLDNHNLGNLFLALSGKYSNNMIDSLRALEQAVEAVGHVYPASLELADLCVELNDGTKVVGEAEIDRPTYDRTKKIVRAWLEPGIGIYSGAKNAIESADYIIFSPGSLYTSLVPNLLVKGMREALNNSKAKLVRVIGICYETEGETGPGRLSDFVTHLQNYLPRKTDVLVYSTHEFSSEEKKQLEEKHWDCMAIDPDNIQVKTKLGFDFEKQGGGTDPEKLGKFLKDNVLI